MEPASTLQTDDNTAQEALSAIETSINEANALLERGATSDAYPLICDLANKEESIGGSDGRLALMAGCVAATLNKPTDAVAWFERGVNLDPANPDAYHNLALTHFQQGDFAIAAEVFGRAKSAGIADGSMLRDIGLTFTRMAQFGNALKCFHSSIRISNNPDESYESLLELCYAAKEMRRGRRYLRIWKENSPNEVPIQWQERFAIESESSENIDAIDRIDTSLSRSLKGKKIAFFATQPSFLTEIMTELGAENETQLFQQGNVADMRRILDWCDVAWFDWCDSLLIQVTNHLPKVCPIICRLHSYETFTDMPSQVDWSKVDKIVYVNESVKTLMEMRIPSSVNQTVIHNAIDLDKFTIPTDKQYGKKIASVGYINYKKNPQLLLYCFKAIHDWDPEFELHIAGEQQDPRLELYMRDMARKLGIEIHYHGWIKDMPKFYKEMDFVISTSIFESFHLSIAEGMSSGVIPLVHDWFGADNIYPESCRFLTAEDCLALIQKVMESDRAELAQSYREHIMSNFKLDKQIAEVAEAIESVSASKEANVDKSINLGLVSIIIPTYNRADYLPEALSSALSQTYPHFEIVVVDDGSTDNTQEILAQFKLECPDTVTVITQENKGVSAALNAAMRQSKGEYISWLSSDDAYHPDKLWEDINVLANKTKLGWVYSDFYYMTAQSHLQGRANVKPLDNDSFVEEMFKGNSIHGCSVMFRKSVLEATGHFDEILGGKIGYGADGALWHKMGYHFPFEFIPKALVYYRLHPGQVTHQADIPKSQKEYRKYMEDYFSEVKHKKEKVAIVASPGPRVTAMGSSERLGYGADPDFPEEKSGGKRILWIGTADPCGNAAMYARSINRHTEHLCRVVTFKETRGFDHDIVLRNQDWAGDDIHTNELTNSENERLRDLAERADVLVFSACTYSKMSQKSQMLDDTDGLLWGNLDWADYSKRKECVAFFFGSTATRQNADWYWNRFANEKKWRVATGQIDLKRRWQDAHYVPTWLDIDAKRYQRDLQPSNKTLIVQTPTDPPIKNSAELERVVSELSAKYPNIGLAIKTGLSYEESLNLKRRGQIALDQMQIDDGYYCMSSLENSALGLVNFVYVDKFGRDMIAKTLQTDKLPWQIVSSESELKSGIEDLMKTPERILQLQQETYNWMRQYWQPSKLVHHLTSAILGE